MDKKYSYVTLLTNDSYVYGVVLLVESMKKVNTKYPLHVLITENVSSATKEILNQLQVSFENVDLIETPEDIYQHNLEYDARTAATWKYCWTKLKIFDLVQFSKIIFLDADVMLLKNIDNLFNCPTMTAALDGEYFNLWQGWPHLNAGCIVIEPSHYIFHQLLNFANNLKVDEIPKYIIADQEIINLYFSDWPNKKNKKLNKYYNIFAPYIQENQVEDIKENGVFIHYVGRKPWVFWIKSNLETYSEYFYEQAKTLIEERLKLLDWQKIRSKLKLAVYAICKNEKQNIKKWIKCFSEADYVCILDTGSSDGTWELLQEEKSNYNNLIIQQSIITPWRFDSARNKSLELVPKDTDIYFMVDLDEIIKESGWCQIIKDNWNPLFHRGKYIYNRDVDASNDMVLKQIEEYRIHNKDWMRYENIVHEALVNAAGQKQFFIETCTEIPIVVWHYPNKNSQTNYMELCEQDLLEYPNDWVMRLQLAIEYEIRSEEDKALNHFFYIIQHENTLQHFELGRCYFGIARILNLRNRADFALNYLREGRLNCPEYTDNYLAAAEIYYNNQKYQEVVELCKAAFKNTSSTYWCSAYDIKSYYPYWLLGMSYYFLNNKLKAISFLNMAYCKNKDDELFNIIKEISAQCIQEKILEE